MGLLDKLFFWRRDDPEFEVEGCFTLPGAELADTGDHGEVGDGGVDCASPVVEAGPTDDA